MIKNLLYEKYKDSVPAALTALAKEDGDCPEQLAYHADRVFELGGFDKDVILNNTHIGRERAIYGMAFRDTGSGYVFRRTGALEGFSPDEIPDDEYLPLQRKVKRCILGYDGEVAYYTNALNSMFKEGSSAEIFVDVLDVYAPHSEDDATVTIDGIADSAHVGSMIMLADDDGTREWYAMIIGTDDDKYILSNPLLIDWGLDAEGDPCPIGVIGDAKLDGSEGQFMVEVPGYYYRRGFETRQDGFWEYRNICARHFEGARYIQPYYQSVTEGVGTDSEGKPIDGWTGVWDPVTGTWTNVAHTPLGPTMMSVVGYYPRTTVYRSDVRTMCANLGEPFHQYGFFEDLSWKILMLVEICDFNTQAKVAYGIADWSSADWIAYNERQPIRRGGDTVRAGNRTWDMSTLGNLAKMKANGGKTYTVRSFSWRGIENAWGHLMMWVDGFNLRYDEPDGDIGVAHYYVTDDPELFSDSVKDGHVMLPDRLETSLFDGEKWVSGNRYWRAPSEELLPTVKTPSSIYYIPDYLYGDTIPPAAGSLRLLAVGGFSDSSSNAGAFLVYVSRTSGFRYSSYGGRLCANFKNTINEEE